MEWCFRREFQHTLVFNGWMDGMAHMLKETHEKLDGEAVHDKSIDLLIAVRYGHVISDYGRLKLEIERKVVNYE